MPHRLSQKFFHRKSTSEYQDKSGTGEVPQPSFRVLPRPVSERNPPPTIDASLKRRSAIRATSTSWQAARPSLQRASRTYDGSDSSKRHSGHTPTSRSVHSLIDSQTSDGSTAPSSAESQSREDIPRALDITNDIKSSFQKRTMDSPVEQSQEHGGRDRSFSFKSAAARTFSFGSKRSDKPSPQTRTRSGTETTIASPIAPPKIELGPEVSLGEKGFSSDFGDLLAKRKSTILEEPEQTRNSFDNSSEERLHLAPRLRNPPVGHTEGPTFAKDALMASRFLDQDYSQPFRQSVSPYEAHASQMQAKSRADVQPSSLQKTSALAVKPAGTEYLTSGKVNPGRGNNPMSSNVDEEEPLFENVRVSRSQQNRFLQSPFSNIPKPPPTKVMTPAEYERFKRGSNDDFNSNSRESISESDDESVNYDEEDETERNRQMATQRRKQEAQLAVYRQQMVKVTGEQPSELPSSISKLNIARASQSTPNLLGRASFSGNGPTPMLDDVQSTLGRLDDDDEEDDDIPLGVLQAHGFPNRNRPPTRLSISSYLPPGEQRSYPAPVGSTRNEPTSGGGGSTSLPPFARNLPADPYVGASLVNQAARESLRTMDDAGRHSPSNLIPPGGLVGVIAGEERARAMRRGSPNTHGIYDPPPQSLMGQQYQNRTGYGPQPPVMHAPQSQMVNDPNQAELNQSMTQMMQMQMQWMQQMMAMYNLQGMPMPPMPQFPGQSNSPSPNINIRSSETGLSDLYQQQRLQSERRNDGNLRPHSSAGVPTRQSFLTPAAPSIYNMSMYGPGSGYTPSIAPSERSNVGQPSRYRPVTSYGGVGNARESVFVTPPVLTHNNSMPHLAAPAVSSRPQSLVPPQIPQTTAKTTIRVIDRPKHSASTVSDDDDDEEWAKMAAKKAERKKKWRSTKSVNPDGSQGGMEGLLYEG